ncbi:hypothetical protein K8R78_08665, partial [bacterium]|nr:hypothetical protein [bacterium]
MRTTLVVLLMVGLCLAAADVGFICDDDGTGTYSGLGNVVPDIVGPMGETFTYELIVNNGDTGTYTGDATWWNGYDIVIWYASGTNNAGRVTTTAERDAANAFLGNGGWLLVTGYDVLGSPDDSVM